MGVTRMLLVFLTSLALFGCAHDGPGIKMMEERAEYADDAPEASELNLSVSGALGEAGNLGNRPEPRVAQIWVSPQRISSREHFWGTWVSLCLEGECWQARSLDKFEQPAPMVRPKDGGQSPKRRRSK